MFQILRYIFKNNSAIEVPKYLLIGLIFQLYKRLIGSVVSKKIFNGRSIFLYPRCNVSTLFTYTAIPDKEEVQTLREILHDETRETVFLDIGANIGSYSVCLMDLCSDIIAFEPHPYTLRRCKMNFLLNGFDDTCVYPIALSDHCGTTRFSDFGGSSTINRIVTGNEGIEVSVSTLDAFARDHNFSKTKAYLLKVDVEGFEYNLFKGSRAFLTEYAVNGILFECFDETKVFKLLHEYGYTDIIPISGNNYFARRR